MCVDYALPDGCQRGGLLWHDGLVTQYIACAVKDYFKEKGFADVDVDVLVANDSIIKNAVRVTFDVKKGNKLKIKEISYEGNDEISKFKLDRSMKKTKDAKWYNLFSSKKFQEKEYAGDKDI